MRRRAPELSSAAEAALDVLMDQLERELHARLRDQALLAVRIRSIKTALVKIDGEREVRRIDKLLGIA